MKFNISNPATGAQKIIEIDSEKTIRKFMDKRMSDEVDASILGDEFKGYIFRISGGNDKQGFPMKQGVLANHRVSLLFKKGMSCFRKDSRLRNGMRKRKSVRGCIIGNDLAVINLVIVKVGEQDLPGLTDTQVPRRLGPKRASKIRRLFELTAEDDERQYVVRREIPGKDGKKGSTKAPKIQRLVTPRRLQRRRKVRAEKKNRIKRAAAAKAAYEALLASKKN